MITLLKKHTTLDIGGPATQILSAASEEQLIEHVRKTAAEKQSYLIFGSGSNLLISDDGFKGTVLLNQVKGIRIEGNVLIAKSGTLLQDLVDFANSHKLAGLQSLAGIPGTVGGAVYGNAGAYGQTISDHLVRIKILPPTGLPVFINKNDCDFNYRDSIFKKNKTAILEVEFELAEGNSADLASKSTEIIKKREAKYPPGIKCPGSFFKNIVAGTLEDEILKLIPTEIIMYGKIPAGALLELVGAKGDTLGEIEIAPYHANLFINKGNGTAVDFYKLAQKYVKKVFLKYGIKLQPEVQLINLPPLE